MSEFVKPHEIAKLVKEVNEHEIVEGRVESVMLANTLNESQLIWRMLRDQKFDENEHGYVTLNVLDWTTDRGETSDNVDGLQVVFTDPNGRKTMLGEIVRTTNRLKATAKKIDTSGAKKPMLPDDPYWDAIVGTIERAVSTCYEAQQQPGE